MGCTVSKNCLLCSNKAASGFYVKFYGESDSPVVIPFQSWFMVLKQSVFDMQKQRTKNIKDPSIVTEQSMKTFQNL